MIRNSCKAIIAALLFALAAGVPVRAADAPKMPLKENRLGIGHVKLNPSVAKANEKAGSTIEMGRVVEAMDSQLIDCLHNTRKFEVVARSDLKDLINEQTLTDSGNVDSDDTAAAKAFKIAGCKYLLVTTIDSFQDYQETAQFEALGERATKRIIQFSAVGKIYDATSGVLLESANFQLSNRDAAALPSYVQSNGKLSDALLSDIARLMSTNIANRVVEVIFPAKIVAMTDKIVTINRGDGTGVAIGQTWNVYALGEEMLDPDTGKSLGRQEVKVGAVRITDVQPLFCKAEVVEDHGVDKLQIVRLQRENTSKAPGRP